jgi:hypothetical protein
VINAENITLHSKHHSSWYLPRTLVTDLSSIRRPCPKTVPGRARQPAASIRSSIKKRLLKEVGKCRTTQ